MAERNVQVMDRVREEMDRRPDVGSGELFAMAKQLDSSLEQRSLASFHASYVLPIKREQAQQRSADSEASAEADTAKPSKPRKQSKRGGGRKAAAGAGRAADTEEATPPRRQSARKQSAPAQEAAQTEQPGGRERIRTVFLEFAREFAEAESRTEIVQVLSRVDEFVDRVLQQGR